MYHHRRLYVLDFEVLRNEILEARKRKDFITANDKVMYHHRRLYVPDFKVLRKKRLEGAHFAPYSVHPGSTKIHRDLKAVFSWRGMKDSHVC